MTTEHVCEWKWDIVDNDAWFFCSVPYCCRPMGALEIEARLNATERLSAEYCRTVANSVVELSNELCELMDDSDSFRISDNEPLLAYADALEAR